MRVADLVCILYKLFFSWMPYSKIHNWSKLSEIFFVTTFFDLKKIGLTGLKVTKVRKKPGVLQ